MKSDTDRSLKSELLRNVFGYTSFRGQQAEIIDTVVSGKDALVIMPTGGGKSVCYQIPALLLPGITVVVSPLIALMNDQVNALKQLDVAAEALHSNLSRAEAEQVKRRIIDRTIKLLYVSPEMALTEELSRLLAGSQLSLIAIDEAHCVSIWGNDFRPEYVKLAALREQFPETPMIGLTATADEATRKDIIHQLKLQVEEPFLSGFERPNIFLESKSGLKRMDQIREFLKTRTDEAGIIYCLSRKETQQMADRLKQAGYRAECYHAGMSAEDRKHVQEAFQNDELPIVCATIAFGMGIDKPNIRWVIHYSLPKNVESYYQEIGRGGRDGLPAHALLLPSWSDVQTLRTFIAESDASETFKSVQMAKLDRMWTFANTPSCRTNFILNYFGEYRDKPCGHCDNCHRPPITIDGRIPAQMALSAVIRCGEEAGMYALIDILRGSYRREITEKGWDRLKTHGVGKEWSFEEWRHFLNQLVDQGILAIDFTREFRLKTTPLSREILQNNRSIELTQFVKPEKKKKEKVAVQKEDPDKKLLEHLKAWRIAEAKRQHVPLYTIMHNKTLEQLASFKPKTEAKLLEVEGIGEARLKRYGNSLLDLIDKGQRAD
ncbi:MAG: DNA helicase RecQ [Flavobacteriales bacterium]|nr:DNA helicase RecQ [Flavobacteriales bacterium]